MARCVTFARRLGKGLLVFTAIGLLLGLLHRGPWPFWAAAHWVPAYFVFALCGATLCAVCRAWRWCAGGVGLALCAALLALPAYAPRPGTAESAPHPPNLRILQANLFYNNPKPGRFLGLVEALRPDMLVLQEMNARWRAALQPLEAEFPYHTAQPRYGGGKADLGIYSRFPFEDAAVLTERNIPALRATLSVHGRRITLFNVHNAAPWSPGRAKRYTRHMDVLTRVLRDQEGLVIVAGDLNSSRWSRPLQTLLEQTELASVRQGRGILGTWPSFLGPLRTNLDHMLVSPEIAVTDCAVGPPIGSDHRPLITTLHIPEAFTTLDARDFGLIGDGHTDDGPAIARLLDAARREVGEVRIQFPPDAQVYAEETPGRYVFPLEKAQHWTLDGGGATFLLHPHLRFLSLTQSSNITLCDFNVDFRPLPFEEGTVIHVDPEARTLDVRLNRPEAERLRGGPTREDGEQAFFAMLWRDGPYGLVSRHYRTARIEAVGPGTVRVHAAPEFTRFDGIEPETWRISLPVPGIAHRYGPGACFQIHDSENVLVEDGELWSAPWFGVNVLRNTGEVTFRRVHIRPKPGTNRLMSLWRDGFHVKGNRAALLWEDCILEGMNDDAFNISTHSSVVREILAPTRIQVRQKYPLAHIPWRAGDTLVAADEGTGRLLGAATVTQVDLGPAPPPIGGKPAAPESTLALETPIAGLRRGHMVWARQSANPDTTLRRCTIRMSCRMQSPMTLQDCDVTALLWFYAGHREGPFPSRATVNDCLLRRGRGNPAYAVIFAGLPHKAGPDAAAPPRAMHDIQFTGN